MAAALGSERAAGARERGREHSRDALAGPSDTRPRARMRIETEPKDALSGGLQKGSTRKSVSLSRDVRAAGAGQ